MFYNLLVHKLFIGVVRTSVVRLTSILKNKMEVVEMSTGELSANSSVFEKIRPWTEIKHQIIAEYAHAYSVILASRRQPKLRHVYVDAFAGAGRYVSRQSGILVPGSPEIALNTVPPFTEYHFIDIDDVKLSKLEAIAAERSNVFTYHGDCNRVLLEDILPKIRFESYKRGLCILDPYGMHLDWRTVDALGSARSFEVFLNFPIMDMNMNALHRDPSTILPSQAERMSRFWGDSTWQSEAFRTREQLALWGDPGERKVIDNEGIASAYRDRLRRFAGFSYVPEPLPMRNSTGATVYYLFFASHYPIAQDIVEEIFGKFRR